MSLLKKVLEKILYFQSWEYIHNKYRGIPGVRGIQLRQKKYKNFFLKFGNSVIINEDVIFENPDGIILEDDVRINKGTWINGSGGVYIGYKTLIGPHCFISSANHNIKSNEFFYESGYVYHYTYISAFCLISGYAKLLAGTELGSGSFVANSSLVTKGKYGENSYLFGLPAVSKLINNNICKNDEQELIFKKIKDVAIFVPSAHHCSSIELFFQSLGLPQCIYIKDINQLPAECHTIILVLNNPKEVKKYKALIHKKQPSLNIWTPYQFSTESNNTHYFLPNTSFKDQILPLTHKIIYKSLPSRSTTRSTLENIFLISCKYTIQYIIKSSLVKNSDILCAKILLKFISEIDVEFSYLLTEAIHNYYKKKGISANNHLESLTDEALNTLRESYTPDKAIDLEMLTLLYWFQKVEHPLDYKVIKSRIINNNKAHILVCYGIIAYCLNYLDLFEHAYSKLLENNYCSAATYILNQKDGKSYYYRPFLALFMMLQWKIKYKNKKLTIFYQKENKIKWYLNSIATEGFIDWSHFTHVSDQAYSTSLVENLIFALSAIKLNDGFEFLIDESNYEPLYTILQSIWSNFLRSLILKQSDECIELYPWPNGKPWAFSLRYDVDRPVSAQRIQELINWIKNIGLDPCSTWYFFDKTDESKQRSVKKYGGEIGIHMLADECKEGLGVTFHSGANSDYWRGLKAYTQDPLYTEFLQLQVSKPMTLFHNDKKHNILPLHFPMETSTNDTDGLMQNKEFYAEKIRQQIMVNGHIILASHPDITKNNMDSTIRKFQLMEGWAAPIKDVTQRIQKIFFESQMSVYKKGNSIFIKSACNIDRLSLKIHFKDGKVINKIINVKANTLLEILND